MKINQSHYPCVSNCSTRFYGLVFFPLLLVLTATAFARQPHILVMSKTNGFRHKAIPVAITALKQIAATNHWTLTFTEDSLSFSQYRKLKKYDAIVFLFATGKIFGTEEEHAFQKYLERGGALATIHTGTDLEMNWIWYMDAIGARFKGHPKQQSARLVVEDSVHLSTKMLPSSWMHFDEWYNFAAPVSSKVKVLLSIDETSYSGGTMNGHHPIAWTASVGKGRIFQSALGHTEACYTTDSLFLAHLKGGIEWCCQRK